MQKQQQLMNIHVLLFIICIFEAKTFIIPSRATDTRFLENGCNSTDLNFSKTKVSAYAFEITIDLEDEAPDNVNLVEFINKNKTLNFSSNFWNFTNKNQIALSPLVTKNQREEIFGDNQTEMSFSLQLRLSNHSICKYNEAKQITLVKEMKSPDINFIGLIDEIKDQNLNSGKGYKFVDINTSYNLSYEIFNIDYESTQFPQRNFLNQEKKIDLQDYIGRKIVLVFYDSMNSTVYITKHIFILDEEGLDFNAVRTTFIVKENVEQNNTVIVNLSNDRSHFFNFNELRLINANEKSFSIKLNESKSYEDYRIFNLSFKFTKDYIGEYYPSFKFAEKEISLNDTIILHIKECPKEIFNITKVEDCYYQKLSIDLNVTKLPNLELNLFLLQKENLFKFNNYYNSEYSLSQVDILPGSALLLVTEGNDTENPFQTLKLNFTDITIIHRNQSVTYINRYDLGSIMKGEKEIAILEASCIPNNLTFTLKNDKIRERVLKYNNLTIGNNNNLIISIEDIVFQEFPFGYSTLIVNEIEIGKVFYSNYLNDSIIEVSAVTHTYGGCTITVTCRNYYLGRISYYTIDNIEHRERTFNEENNSLIIEENIDCSLQSTLTFIDHFTNHSQDVELKKIEISKAFEVKDTFLTYEKESFPILVDFNVYLNDDYNASMLLINDQSNKCSQTDSKIAKCQISLQKASTITITITNNIVTKEIIDVIAYSGYFPRCLEFSEESSLTGKQIIFDIEIPKDSNTVYNCKINSENINNYNKTELSDYIKYTYTFELSTFDYYEISLTTENRSKVLKEIELIPQIKLISVRGELKEWIDSQELIITLSKGISNIQLLNIFYLKNSKVEVPAENCTVLEGNLSIKCNFNLENVENGNYELLYKDNCGNLNKYTNILVSKQNTLISLNPKVGVKNKQEPFIFTYANSIENITGVQINNQIISISKTTTENVDNSDNIINLNLNISKEGVYQIWTIYNEDKLTLEDIELIIIEKEYIPVLSEDNTSIYLSTRVTQLEIPFTEAIDINDILSIKCDNIIFTNYRTDNNILILPIPISFRFTEIKNYIFKISFIRTNTTVSYNVNVKDLNASVFISKFLYIKNTYDITITINAPNVSNLFVLFEDKYRSLKTDGNGNYNYTTKNSNEEIYIGFTVNNDDTIYDLDKPIYIVDDIGRIFILPEKNCWYKDEEFPRLKLKNGFNFDYSKYKYKIVKKGLNEIYDSFDSEGDYTLQIYLDNEILYNQNIIVTDLSIKNNSTQDGIIYINSKCDLQSQNFTIRGDDSTSLQCSFYENDNQYNCIYSNFATSDTVSVYYNNWEIGYVTLEESFSKYKFTVISPEIITKGENIFKISSEYDLNIIDKITFKNQNGDIISYCKSGCNNIFQVYLSWIVFTLDFTNATTLSLIEIQNKYNKTKQFNDITFTPSDISFTVEPYLIYSNTNKELNVKIIANDKNSITITQVNITGGENLISSSIECSLLEICSIKLSNLKDNQIPKESKYIQFTIMDNVIQSKNKIFIINENNVPSLIYHNYFLDSNSKIIKAIFNNENINNINNDGLLEASILYNNNRKVDCVIVSIERATVSIECQKNYLSSESVIEIKFLSKVISIKGVCGEYATSVLPQNVNECKRCPRYFLNGECYDTCPENYYSDNGTCVQYCSKFIQENACVENCDANQGYGIDGKGSGFNLCVKCADIYKELKNGICTSNCEDGYELLDNNCVPITSCTSGYCNYNGDCILDGDHPTCKCKPNFYGQTCQVRENQIDYEINRIISTLLDNNGSLPVSSLINDISLVYEIIYYKNESILTNKYKELYSPLLNILRAVENNFEKQKLNLLFPPIMLIGKIFQLKKENNETIQNDDLGSFMSFIKKYQILKIKKQPKECKEERDLLNNFIFHLCPLSQLHDKKFTLNHNSRRLTEEYISIDFKSCVEGLNSSFNSSYIGINEVNSEELRGLLQANNTNWINKYFFSAYNDGNFEEEIPINTCNNIQIKKKFDETLFEETTPYNYMYYINRKVNVLDMSDPVYTKLCYVNDELDFDLPQKFRQELYSNYSQKVNELIGGTFINNCFKKLSINESSFEMNCSFSEAAINETESENKKVISGQKNLIFKCSNHVSSSLGKNIAFWVFLIIMILFILVFFIFWKCKRKVEIENLGIQKGEKGITPKDINLIFKEPSLHSIFMNNFFQVHSFFPLRNFSPSSPLEMNIWFLVFKILSLFGLNALYFSESHLEKRINANKSQSFVYPLVHEFDRIIFSILTSIGLTLVAKLICLIDFWMKNSKNRFIKRRIFSCLFMLIFMIFFFCCSVIFCGIYRKAENGWIFSGVWSLLFNWIILSPVYILIISIIELFTDAQNDVSAEKIVYYLKFLFVF